MGIRVILADDHQMVLDGLRSVLKNEPDIELAGAATNGLEAVELAARLQPDVAVLDVTMPKMNGVEALREIRKRSPDTEVILLSMHAAAQIVADALHAGASGYVVKGASVNDLVVAIRTVMNGETFISAQINDTIPPELLRRSFRPGETAAAALSAREVEVLRLVAEGKSSKEAAKCLFVTTKTIVWHRQSIMAKLGLHTVPELTKYAIRMG
ncbi:MAG: response regulator, partial [Tepidisphaerales bacterium]